MNVNPLQKVKKQTYLTYMGGGGEGVWSLKIFSLIIYMFSD